MKRSDSPSSLSTHLHTVSYAPTPRGEDGVSQVPWLNIFVHAGDADPARTGYPCQLGYPNIAFRFCDSVGFWEPTGSRGSLVVHFRSGLHSPCLHFTQTVTRLSARLSSGWLARPWPGGNRTHLFNQACPGVPHIPFVCGLLALVFVCQCR